MLRSGCGLLALCLSACGTTHQFVPARPLPKGEWQLSFAWHYDFNTLSRPVHRIWPDFNAWVGTGNETNFGFGLNMLALPTHLSLAHYEHISGRASWGYFFHLNQLLSPHRNPWLEAGVMYSEQHGSAFGTVSGGLTWGHGHVAPLLDGCNTVPGTGPYAAFQPFLKYTYVGREIGASVSYYHNHSASAASVWPLRERHGNDTLEIIRPFEIDSVIEVEHPELVAVGTERRIYFRDSSFLTLATGAVTFCAFSPRHDGAGHVPPAPYALYWYHGRSRGSPTWPTRSIILNWDAFGAALAGEATIYLTLYPPDLNDAIRRSYRIWNDLSMAVAMIKYPD